MVQSPLPSPPPQLPIREVIRSLTYSERLRLTPMLTQTFTRRPPADMILSRAPDLRAQLAAVISTNQHNAPHGYNDVPASSSASPHDHNIDPAMGGPGGMMGTGADSGGDDSMGDGRKGGKRELSQSKRAAQNRAAQVRCSFRRVLEE